uniref:Uncharacterized protein n=1 Tax=Lepeophtheirus salmonis TaxID=72036 RepID=A0A0K2T240_LEPSM
MSSSVAFLCSKHSFDFNISSTKIFLSLFSLRRSLSDFILVGIHSFPEILHDGNAPFFNFFLHFNFKSSAWRFLSKSSGEKCRSQTRAFLILTLSDLLHIETHSRWSFKPCFGKQK